MKEYCRGKSWKNFCFSIVTSRWHCKPGNAMASSAFSQQMALNSVEYSNWVLERPSTSTSGAGRVLEYLTALADIRSYHPALPYLHLSSSQLMEMYRRHGRLILWIGSHCTANQSSSFSPSPSIVWDILKNVPTTWEIHFCFSTTVSHSVQFRI